MALIGDIKELTLADIIQINCIGRNTARLLVHYPIGDGIFFFQDGEVFHATLGNFSGETAIYEALKYNEGAFRIDAMVPAPKRTIVKPWQELLMDGMRHFDEQSFDPNKEFNPEASFPSFSPEEILARRTQNMPVLANKEKDHLGAVINDKYRIERRIKDGELGTMYLATHIQMDVPVAVKVMHAYLVNDEAAMERFRRGAHAAAKIHHPNAINVIDFGVTKDEIVYMVMEYLKGVTLRDRILKQKRIAAVECAKMLKHICSALEAAHRQEIIHRDLKPENIMFDESSGEEIVKVLDFGLAKLKALGNQEGVLTAHGLVLGTHDYMSPELCEGGEIDRRSDIYSLGVLLYEALTGRLPFIEATPVGMALKHIGTKPDSMRKYCPDISESVDRVVMKALEKSPGDRQQTALSLAQEFEQALVAVKQSPITIPRPKASNQEYPSPNNPYATRSILEISGGELGESRSSLSFDKFYQEQASNTGTASYPPSGVPYKESSRTKLIEEDARTKPVPAPETKPIGKRSQPQKPQKALPPPKPVKFSNLPPNAPGVGTLFVDDQKAKKEKQKQSVFNNLLNSNLALFILTLIIVVIIFLGVLLVLYYFTSNGKL